MSWSGQKLFLNSLWLHVGMKIHIGYSSVNVPYKLTEWGYCWEAAESYHIPQLLHQPAIEDLGTGTLSSIAGIYGKHDYLGAIFK